MKITIVLGFLAAFAAAAPTPHGQHERSISGTTVDDISDQLYGRWGDIHKRDSRGTTVDDISDQLYGKWGGIDKRHDH